MKTIPNKRTTIEEGEGLVTYAQLMKIVMSQRKPEGFSTEEMRKDFRVIDAIESKFKTEEISLEDADFEYFKSKLKAMRWSGAHKDVIKFEDDINAIK